MERTSFSAFFNVMPFRVEQSPFEYFQQQKFGTVLVPPWAKPSEAPHFEHLIMPDNQLARSGAGRRFLLYPVRSLSCALRFAAFENCSSDMIASCLPSDIITSSGFFLLLLCLLKKFHRIFPI